MFDPIPAQACLIHSGWRQKRAALLEACRGHRHEELRACMLGGVNIEWRDPKTGGTALGLCARAGFEHGVSRLLMAGADVRARDKMGRTALILAGMARDAGCVQTLLDHGADPEDVDVYGQGALDACARSFAPLAECSRVVEALSKRVGARTAQRALREASIFGGLGAAQAIVEHCALPPAWVAGAGKAGLAAWSVEWRALWDPRASEWLQKEGFIKAERRVLASHARACQGVGGEATQGAIRGRL